MSLELLELRVARMYEAAAQSESQAGAAKNVKQRRRNSKELHKAAAAALAERASAGIASAAAEEHAQERAREREHERDRGREGADGLRGVEKPPPAPLARRTSPRSSVASGASARSARAARAASLAQPRVADALPAAGANNVRVVDPAIAKAEEESALLLLEDGVGEGMEGGGAILRPVTPAAGGADAWGAGTFTGRPVRWVDATVEAVEDESPDVDFRNLNRAALVVSRGTLKKNSQHVVRRAHVTDAASQRMLTTKSPYMKGRSPIAGTRSKAGHAALR